MKLNLLFNNEKDILDGYLNIDPLTPEEDQNRIKCELHQLTDIVDFNECDEIIAKNLITLYPGNEVDEVITHWLSLLKHKGTITLTFVDINEVAKYIAFQSCDLEESNSWLYSGQQCALSLHDMVSVLQNKGFNILKSRIVNKVAVIVAERP